jgi:drug/metabolite transporter (DMT)-like permease
LSGIPAALLAAVLFGASTPLAKLLLSDVSPQLLAGLLYLGSGVGLGGYLLMQRRSFRVDGRDWLALAISFGGVLGPVLLMLGLRQSQASSASLLLNLEGVFTALLAWFAFGENVDRRVAVGMGLIVAGGLVLAWPTGALQFQRGALLVCGACLCWALDNNFTQKVSGSDPISVAAWKGGVAGLCNLALALAFGARLPGAGVIAGSMLVGLGGYGISLVCFIVALRQLGTARTSAYFSLAPFVGGALSLLCFHEPLSGRFLGAAFLMGAGVYLHLTEHHEHEHRHEPMEHSHEHVHDAHHQHQHGPDDPSGEPHTHWHRHDSITHTHRHYPDLHHRH